MSMPDENKPRRLRAALKNALVWGTAWGALGTAVATVFRLNDNIPLLNAIADGIGMGVRIGVVGAIVGGAFAAFISLRYRGRKLSEISWMRFGAGGLILAGLFVPAYLQTMNVITGGGLVPWHLVFDDFLFSAIFGGITAAGTMKLAQLNEAANPVTVQELLERMEHESLGAGDATGYTAAQRARSAEHL